jgi:CRP/FNR family transcriptional regulator, dissimilatory nitrate respiration regulator
MEQYYSILKRCPLFQHIEEADFQILFPCIQSQIKKYTQDEYIILSGDEVHTVGIVLEGALELIKENPAGGKHILDFLGPSHVFGEGIVCTYQKLAPVTVRVKEDAKILSIPFDRIIKPCSNSCGFHVQLIKNMMMILGEKNYYLNQKIDLLMLKGMREKLATFLLRESEKQKSKTFQVIPNRNELAEFLNVSRPSMCRELGRMKEEGILDFYQNSFRILNMEALVEALD